MLGPKTIAELEELLSTPTEAAIASLGRIDGDILILGAGGKMGPTLARMARRASDQAQANRRIIAVSRFSDSQVKSSLEAAGVETISGNLMDESFIASLPKCENVIFMVGQKFGTDGEESRTWATNAYLPGLVCRTFADSRIVCFSTGNVYGLVPIDQGQGSVETDELNPMGEYAMSCLGRERICEYFSRQSQTPVSIFRLNYATELRYGLLVDLAQQVLSEQPISLATGYFNVIWQAEASAMALCSLEHASSPPFYINSTGAQRISCRDVCLRLGELLNKEVTFSDSETNSALLSDARRAFELFGHNKVSLDEMLVWTADWLLAGNETWNKPTHFEVRDGKF